MTRKDIFSQYIKDDYITFKYAKGASDMFGKEFHTYHEIIFFMGGKAEFISDKIHMELKENTLIVIPKQAYHQLLITGAQNEYYRCVFNFFDVPELQILISESMKTVYVTEINQEIQYLFDKMISLTKNEVFSQIKKIVLRSVLSILLTEILQSDTSYCIGHTHENITSEAIEYIEKHISEDVSLSKIAKSINVSVSTLSHTFKKNMNISIYQYILKKRLVLAHKKILMGEPATKAASECGFKDYSGFYKQYKKMFGIAPSSRKNI